MTEPNASVWESAPETDVIPFLEPAQRATLVNDRVLVIVTAMEYDPHGRFGPKFIATFMLPDGSSYQYSFPAHPSRPTPRDYTNKWMREQCKRGLTVPAVFCKANGAYFLGKPGSESEKDGPAATINPSATGDMMGEPPF